MRALCGVRYCAVCREELAQVSGARRAGAAEGGTGSRQADHDSHGLP